MRQFVVTPAMGKRLIGKGMAAHPAIRQVLRQGTLVIVAGTTNGYVAEEILAGTGQSEGFSRRGFRRGVVTPPGFDVAAVAVPFPGDVVLTGGAWRKGMSIADVAAGLGAGDVILKGGNAVDREGRSAVLIGDAKCGTAGLVLPAVVGRRARLIVPIGLEKRVMGDVRDLADLLNAPTAQGPRMLPLPGEAFTELDALDLLTGAQAWVLAGGGVYGAEGALWLGAEGTAGQMQAVETLLASLAKEPPCEA